MLLVIEERLEARTHFASVAPCNPGMTTSAAVGAEMEETLHLQQQAALIAACEAECDSILQVINANVLGVETEHFAHSELSSKSSA